MNKDNLQKIILLRHKLHSIAELSNEEHETKEELMHFMTKNTDFEVVDQGAWFYCIKKSDSGDSPIAFRADFDALPIDETISLPYASKQAGVSHKCGHDGHSAVLAGLGLELTGKSVKRTVVLIFQHAEEIGQGGKVCAELIPELHISEIYAFHNLSGYPEGSIVYRSDLTQPASEGLTIRFTGAKSHASNPEQGRNPSFAIADLVFFIRECLHEEHEGMLLCTIVNISAGTKDFGISAGDGELSLTLRAENEAEMAALEKQLLEKAHELASRDGLTVSKEISDVFPETRNDNNALSKVLHSAEQLHFKTKEMHDLWRASEDFGWYQKKCSGAIFYIGNGENYPSLHTAAYDFNDIILGTAVDMLIRLSEEE